MTDLPPGVGSPSSARWLFSDHFLAQRLPGWPDWAALDVRNLHADFQALWARERATIAGANEGQTEERLIRPVLQLLGHTYTLFAELPGAGKTPDYLFYESDTEREVADAAGGLAKVERALAVGDAKRFDLPLDRRSAEGDPVAQIRDYVLISRRPFGILTNGRVWRLYSRDTGLVERACHEIDLVKLLEEGTIDDLRYFAAFFGASAFRPGVDGRSFLERALADSALHAVEVSGALQQAVFAAVPPIASGLLGDEEPTRESLDTAFANALVFLYRLLFCLFAEARGLLPVENPDYRRYSAGHHRIEVVRLIDGGRHLSATSDNLYAELRALFRAIDRGDPGLGVTEYDGGLFDPDGHPWLEGRSVPDATLAPALVGIYRIGEELVDYRNLSVRTLGSVYEQLLAWELVERDGELVLVESSRRHELGAYFTPEPIVDAIVSRTLDPLTSRLSARVREQGLTGETALEALLDLRVLDPAMGSGHFLVGAVEFIAQAIATDPSYEGDLSLAELRRLVAERCLYGVDLNPLAVELARLSLWLLTAREGEALTFLGNLRVGDSLIGADNETLLDPMTGLLEAHLADAAGELLRQAGELQRRATHSAADAREKRRLAEQIDGLRLPLEVFAAQSLERFRPPAGRPFFHWTLEFPEVFVDERGEPREGAGFDAVVGNPPYIRVQEIGRELAVYCRARFASAHGSFDAYVVFLERGLGLLAPHGRLGFIVPNKLFKLDFAQKLRERLSRYELVDEVLDFGASQLFAGATNYTCLLVLDAGGIEQLSYRRLIGTREHVLEGLSSAGSIPAERFRTRKLGREPWTLVPPDEAALLRVVADGSERLDQVTHQIFQGLITGADDVYVLKDRGWRGNRHIVWSRASGRELELEPDLLHPLASGGDVDRYAFRPLESLLLFPYRRGGNGRMRLLTATELKETELTNSYLREHEERLRAREDHRMDHEGWYAFSRTQSLGLHDRPKLGVPRLCERLRVALDEGGAIYLDNVDVNGVLFDGPAPWGLLAELNSRLLDWIFRRMSVPFQNDYWSANKQFIAGLPIRVPEGLDAAAFAELGKRLHELSRTVVTERAGFLDWLASSLGTRRAKLPRLKQLERFETLSGDELVGLLVRGRARLQADPRERSLSELIRREHRAAAERLVPISTELSGAEREADERVFDLYRLPLDQRRLVEAEYE
jgi:hypothetical protein